jgi:pyruvate dehydrogenase E2 component (dihydrolipoamide acetyltransferase)
MVRDIEAAIAGGTAQPAGTASTGAVASVGSGSATGVRAADAAVAGPAQPVKSTSVSGIRKVIAERMHASLASTAQLTMNAAADARAVLAYRKKLKASEDENLASISINDLVLFATSRVVAEHQFVNATFADGTINEFAQVDLGFAVDTPRGLMVPVIRAAEQRSLAGIAAEAHRLAAACLDGSIKPDELGGGTFTVTNLGAFGIESFTPVLNVPQVAILGVCAVTQRPTADGLVPHMGLSLTVDHQVVDGAPAARFLQAVGRAIGEFDLTLAR